MDSEGEIMKRGLTLVEVLTVICIIAIIGAITFPAFVQIRRSSQKTACMNNLHSFGTAITLYRIDYNGADQGTPGEMGLPDYAHTRMKEVSQLRCHGSDPMGSEPG